MSNHLMRVGMSGLDTSFPTSGAPVLNLNEFAFSLTVSIADNPTISTINEYITDPNNTLTSILVAGPVYDVITDAPGYFNVQRGQNGVIQIGVVDAFADEFLDAALRSKTNATVRTNLQTTNTATLSTVNSLTTQASTLLSKITTIENYDLDNRATVLERIVDGGEGNAITDLLSNSSSITVEWWG